MKKKALSLLLVSCILLYGCTNTVEENQTIASDNVLPDEFLETEGDNWEWLIQPGEYEEVKLLNSSLIAVKDESESYGIINREKNAITGFEFFNVWGNEDSILVIDHDKKYSLLDCEGNLISKETYDEAELLYEELAAVRKNDTWGFINDEGDLVIDYQYDDVKDGFSDGLAAVKKDGKWQFIDINGKSAFGMNFEDVHPFHDGLAAVMENGKWGFIDSTGKKVIETQYEEVGNFGEGLAAVCKEINDVKQWAYIDKQGNVCIDFAPYDTVEGHMFIMGEFHDDYAVITDSLYCLIDRNGQKVLNEDGFIVAGGFDYDKETGVIPAYGYTDEDMKVKKYGFVDIGGNEVIPFIFYNVSTVQGDLAAVATQDNMRANGVIVLKTKELMQSDMEYHDVGNPFFFSQETTYLTASIVYYEDVEIRTVKRKEIAIQWLKNYEKGNLFKMSIEPFENLYNLDESRLNIYFYVTADEIYRLWSYVIQDQELITFYNDDELLMELLDTDEKLIENGELVCCKEDVADELESGEVGTHFSIHHSRSQVEYNRTDVKPNGEPDYYESFVWDEGRGLIRYRSGYRAEAAILEIDNITLGKNEVSENEILSNNIEELQAESKEAFQALLNGTKYFKYQWIIEKHEGSPFGYYDVNQDGLDELVIQEKDGFGGVVIFMYQDGEVDCVCDMGTNYNAYLLENGMVWYHRPGVAPMHDYYQCFAFDGVEYQRIVTFTRSDWNENGYYEEDGAGDKYFYCGEEVSKTEWEELMRPYTEYNMVVLHDMGIITTSDEE